MKKNEGASLKDLSPEQLKEAYESYRKLDVDKVIKERKDEIERERGGLTIMSKIAKNATYDDFVNFVKHDELPAIKLSKDEMESVKGGCVACIGWMIACVVVAKLPPGKA